MRILAFLLTLAFPSHMHANEPSSRLKFVDDFLVKWDRFAQGDNSLVPYVRDNRAKFEEDLAFLLEDGEPAAVGRLVFYAVVQVGGFIDSESRLGEGVLQVFGRMPTTEGKNGEKMIFAGDLYFWWLERRSEYPEFPLYLEWEKRPFSQNVTIRMFHGVRENQKKG
jgi:hypothetical protein